MKKIDWDAFKQSQKYQNLPDDIKRVLNNVYLEGLVPSEALLYDFIALEEGEITLKEFKKKRVARLLKNNKRKCL